ncbi:MAG: response regulator receiver domain protein [Tardiphaga sp.]|nr:response regulator receiver domain protein [Tardiphaga sp.]
MTLANRPIDPGDHADAAGQRDRGTAKSRLVILIVEDDTLLRMHAAEMIEEAGFEVIEAPNADEAIVVLEARLDIAIVFTDIDMPGSMNGLKLAHAIANRWPPIRIVATSGHFKMRDGELPAGGQFIAKPYRSQQILTMLQELADALA